MSAVPARADDTAARSHETKGRAATSLNLNNAGAAAGIASRPASGVANGFIYTPGSQSPVAFHGRFNVGKTGVYVPYYGNLGADPAHPNVQGVAGIGYGFRTWDVSVQNGGFSAGSVPPPVPGADIPKANPSLSLSIRF